MRLFEGRSIKSAKAVLAAAAVMLLILLNSCGASETTGTGTHTTEDVNVSATSYDMELKLDTENDRLDEVVRMELTNNGSTEVDTLYLRFYPNGYVPFLKKSYPDENKGKKLSSEITSVVIEGTDKELPLKYDWDDTSIKVSLDGESIPAGGTLEIEVRAWTDLPIDILRFGASVWDEGKLYHLQFCYPYLEYNKDGWFLDPPRYSYLENRNPMPSDYHVTINAPKEYLIAGPGKITRDGEKTTIEAENLRDLALFASNCMDVDEFELNGVRVSNYYLKLEGAEEYRKYSKQFLTDAFDNLTEMAGDYNRSEFSLVEGTTNMEYSGIAEVSGRGFYEYDPSKFVRVYSNTIHEVTHQWFFDSVGNYEYREGWIDEGFTQFLTEEIMCKDTVSSNMIKEKDAEAVVGKAFYDERADRRELLKQDLETVDHFPLADIDSNPLKTYMGMKVTSDMNLGYREYDFGPLFLSQTEEIMGEEEFYNFVREVYSTYSNKIANSEGILGLIRKHCDNAEMNNLISFYFE